MIAYINLGGKSRPVSFGFQVAYDYEFNTGRSYNALLVSVSKMFMLAAEYGSDGLAAPEGMELDDVAKVMSGDLEKSLGQFSVVPMTDLVYYGMCYACRKEGIEVNFEPSDVAGWLFNDQDALSDCIRLMFESLPQTEKKKAKTLPPTPGKQRVSTGKN